MLPSASAEMKGAPIPPAARQALWLLALDALGALGLAAFVLLYHRAGGAWYTASDALIGAAMQGLWVLLLLGYFRGQETDDWNGLFVAYRALFPLLVAWRGLLFFLTLAGVLGAAGGPGTVSWLLLFAAWGGGLLANIGVYVFSLRLLMEPASPAPRLNLRRWLEWSALLGAAMTVMNVYPPGGLPRPDVAEMLVWGLSGALDVAALLLLRRALAHPPPPAV